MLNHPNNSLISVLSVILGRVNLQKSFPDLSVLQIYSMFLETGQIFDKKQEQGD